jgi:phosphopentomutase
MANLVDFDMLYGHRQDAPGYAAALEAFDTRLPEIQQCLRDGDALVLTADHGNDPTDRSTDHTREYVPLLWYGPSARKNGALGVRSSFADAGKTILDFFEIEKTGMVSGTSFFAEVK